MSERHKLRGAEPVAIPAPYAKSYIIDMLTELRDMAGLCGLTQTQNLLSLATEAARLSDGALD